MNIDQYREMKAQIESETSTQTEVVPDVQTEQSTVVVPEETIQTETQAGEPPVASGTQTETQTAPVQSEEFTFEYEGKALKKDDIESVLKEQAKVMEERMKIASMKEQIQLQEQYYNAIQSNPEFAKKLAETFNLPYISPEEQRIKAMSDDYNRLLVEKELAELKVNYGDVDAKEVIEFAVKNQISTLENAYLLLESKKSQSNPRNESVDLEQIKQQIRQELELELKSNVDTGTIISTRSSSQEIVDNSPSLSAAEMKVAKAMKMSATEYAKWRSKR